MQRVAVFFTVIGLCFATTISFPRFDAQTLQSIQLNGVAANLNPASDSKLHITSAGNAQVGSGFLRTSINLGNDASFSAAFSFSMTNGGGASDEDGYGADGIVFIVNGVTNIVGSAGGGIGYQGLRQSIGIEFDSWNNGLPIDINGNHIGININGDIQSVQSVPYPVRFNNGGAHFAWVDYNGATQTLEVRVSETETRPAAALLTRVVNLVSVLQTSQVYVGFSAATGGAYENHLINGWTFEDTYAPITAPVVAPTSVCGNGIIEAGESCDGGSCCTATCTFAASTSTCRASAGTCDVAETYTGSSASCPADTFAPSTLTCRPAANSCDIAETCTGSTSTCPADVLSMTAPCFCGRQSNVEKPFPEYYCTPNPGQFYMCVYGAFLPQSALMFCGGGTSCGCSSGTECSCSGQQSPCVLTGQTQTC